MVPLLVPLVGNWDPCVTACASFSSSASSSNSSDSLVPARFRRHGQQQALREGVPLHPPRWITPDPSLLTPSGGADRDLMACSSPNSTRDRMAWVTSSQSRCFSSTKSKLSRLSTTTSEKVTHWAEVTCRIFFPAQNSACSPNHSPDCRVSAPGRAAGCPPWLITPCGRLFFPLDRGSSLTSTTSPWTIKYISDACVPEVKIQSSGP
mmetsp:Transcript_14610/g.32363  ORF Transcript_14610/g.32363 Transcript_14610/m.32363 type:complete len:207 (+) Transcript_14610:483-1103(+)